MLGFSKNLFLFFVAAMLLQVQVVQSLNFALCSPDIETKVNVKAKAKVQPRFDKEGVLKLLSRLPIKGAKITFLYCTPKQKLQLYRDARDHDSLQRVRERIIKPLFEPTLPHIIPLHKKSDCLDAFKVITAKTIVKTWAGLIADAQHKVNVNEKTINGIVAFEFGQYTDHPDKNIVQDYYFMVGILKKGEGEEERQAFMLESFISSKIKEDNETNIAVAPSWESLIQQINFQNLEDVMGYSCWSDAEKKDIEEVLMPKGVSEEKAILSANHENLRKYLASCKVAQCTYL